MIEQILQPIYHGGALDKAIAQYGGDAADWLDLSTGINPYHYPINKTSSLSWMQLPQQSALDNLLAAASTSYGCPKSHILAANGTQRLIEILPLLLPKSTIAILSPTYQEHQVNWQRHGHKVSLVEDIEAAMSADHLIIVNPNNPTGKLFTPDEIEPLRAHFAAKNGYLIIDEAFMDMTPEMSMAQNAGQDGLIILRSFGKFFGLAGLRIGFMLAAPDILAQIKTHIGLWDIAGMAIDLATTALNDLLWQQNMRQTLADDMQNMHQILQQSGFQTIGYTNLFCLVKMPNNQPNADKYFDKLARQHILTRKFLNDNKILRFGLPTMQQQAEFTAKLNQICQDFRP